MSQDILTLLDEAAMKVPPSLEIGIGNMHLLEQFRAACSPERIRVLVALVRLAFDSRSYLVSLESRITHECPLKDGTHALWKAIDAARAQLEQTK